MAPHCWMLGSSEAKKPCREIPLSRLLLFGILHNKFLDHKTSSASSGGGTFKMSKICSTLCAARIANAVCCLNEVSSISGNPMFPCEMIHSANSCFSSSNCHGNGSDRRTAIRHASVRRLSNFRPIDSPHGFRTAICSIRRKVPSMSKISASR